MEFIKEDVYAAARIIGCSYDELVDALSNQLREGFSIVPLYRHVPLPHHPNGKLCRLSQLGKDQGLHRNVEALGHMESAGFDSDMVKVRWDRGEGRWSSAELYHKDLIEVLDD